LLPPFVLIDVGGFIVLFFVAVSVLLRARSGAVVFPRFRRGFFRTLAPVLFNDAVTSRPWKTCSRAKWVAHISLFWGFLLLGAATTLAFFMKPEGAVLSLNHPVKILGNLGGAMVLIGFVPMFYLRYQESGSPWHFNRVDLFLISLFLTTVSGFAIETVIYTFGRSATLTSVAYWTHLVLLTLLLASAPYTKFMHAIYNPSWLLHERLATTVNVPISTYSSAEKGMS